jgi:hypothetical protein
MNDVVVLLVATLAALIFLQAGLLLLLFVSDERAPLSLPESLSSAFGLGVGLMTFQMLLMSLAGISFRVPALLAPWGIGWTMVAFTARGRLRRVFAVHTIRPPERLTIRQEVVTSALLCLLVGLVLLVFYHAWLFPVFDWDAWAIWDLKARAFLHDAGIKPFLADGYYGLTHQDYPLLYPLAGTLLYLLLPTPHHIVQFIPATFYVCSLVQYASALRRLGASNLLALALTCGFACLPPVLYLAQHFLSESAFIYYCSTLTIYLFLYLLEGRTSFLLLSAFAAGFLTQVRVEGVLLLMPPLGMLVIRAVTMRSSTERRQALIACGLYGGIVLAIFLPWAVSYRFLTAPEGRLISTSYLAKLLTDGGTVVKALATTAAWMTGLRYLGPFTLLAPVAAALVLLQWRRFCGHWPYAFLLVMVVWSYAPYLGFLIARPEWLFADSLGRYLVAPTVLLYFLVTSELVAIMRRPGAPARFGRLVLAIGGSGLLLWLGADLLGLQDRSPLYHIRPVETARIVLAQHDTFVRLTPLQRIQQLELNDGRMQFSEMLSALLADPLPSGDVIVFRSSANADASWCAYVCQRLYYLLYPRKVRVIDDIAQLQRALVDSHIAALIVYDQIPPWDRVDGDAIFRGYMRYAVIRAPRLRGS